MSRLMESTQHVGNAANTGHVVLAPPTGHKYELLELFVAVGSGSGITVIADLTTAVGYTPLIVTTGLTSGAIPRYQFNALLVKEGQHFDVAVYKTGSGAWGLTAVYMDVDLTA